MNFTTPDRRGQDRELCLSALYRYKKVWKSLKLFLLIAGPGIIVVVAGNDVRGSTAYHSDIARFFIRQTMGLGGEKEAVPSDQLTMAGEQQAAYIKQLAFPASCIGWMLLVLAGVIYLIRNN